VIDGEQVNFIVVCARETAAAAFLIVLRSSASARARAVDALGALPAQSAPRSDHHHPLAMHMKPLAVSMGDPAGIGLELAARVWAERKARRPFSCRRCGRVRTRQRAPGAAKAKAQRRVQTLAMCALRAARCDVLHTPLAMEETPGEPDPVNADATIAAIGRGVAAAREGAASAWSRCRSPRPCCTPPISAFPATPNSSPTSPPTTPGRTRAAR
jgi:hypothetical protein